MSSGRGRVNYPLVGAEGFGAPEFGTRAAGYEYTGARSFGEEEAHRAHAASTEEDCLAYVVGGSVEGIGAVEGPCGG